MVQERTPILIRVAKWSCASKVFSRPWIGGRSSRKCAGRTSRCDSTSRSATCRSLRRDSSGSPPHFDSFNYGCRHEIVYGLIRNDQVSCHRRRWQRQNHFRRLSESPHGLLHDEGPAGGIEDADPNLALENAGPHVNFK